MKWSGKVRSALEGFLLLVFIFATFVIVVFRFLWVVTAADAVDETALEETDGDEEDHGAPWVLYPLLESVDRALLAGEVATHGHGADEVGEHVEGAHGHETDPPVGLLEGQVGLAQVCDRANPGNDMQENTLVSLPILSLRHRFGFHLRVRCVFLLLQHSGHEDEPETEHDESIHAEGYLRRDVGCLPPFFFVHG